MRAMVHVLVEDVLSSGGVDDGTDFAIDIRVVEDWWFRLIVYACVSVSLLVRCRCYVDSMSLVYGGQLDCIDWLKSPSFVRSIIRPTHSGHCW